MASWKKKKFTTNKNKRMITEEKGVVVFLGTQPLLDIEQKRGAGAR